MSIFRVFPKNLKNAFFLLNQRRVYGLGYSTYRQLSLEESVRSVQFDPKNLDRSYGRWMDERIVEYPWLLSRLPRGSGQLLDAGSVLNFDFILRLETFRTKRIFISTLAPESESFLQKGISYVYEDIRDTCYRDGFFDWIVSLSTIEHVGLDNTKLYTNDPKKKESDPYAFLSAVAEFRRILKPGGILYLSVPFGIRKNLGWLQVFDGEMVNAVLHAFSPMSRSEWIFRYQDGAWRSSSREASKNSEYFDCHSEDLKKARVAAAEAVICMELVK